MTSSGFEPATSTNYATVYHVYTQLSSVCGGIAMAPNEMLCLTRGRSFLTDHRLEHNGECWRSVRTGDCELQQAEPREGQCSSCHLNSERKHHGRPWNSMAFLHNISLWVVVYALKALVITSVIHDFPFHPQRTFGPVGHSINQFPMEMFPAFKLPHTVNVMQQTADSVSILYGIRRVWNQWELHLFLFHKGLKWLRTVDARLFGHLVQFYLIMPCDRVWL
jgi:hypothetical protein